MKQFRKWMGGLLTVLMVVSIIPMQAQGAPRKNTKIDNISPALQSLERQVRDKLEPTDSIRLIVELKNSAKINSTLSDKNKGQMIAESKAAIKRFSNTIKTKNLKGKVVNSYSYLFAGVTLETTLAEARKIASLDEVKMVEVAVNFAPPLKP